MGMREGETYEEFLTRSKQEVRKAREESIDPVFLRAECGCLIMLSIKYYQWVLQSSCKPEINWRHTLKAAEEFGLTEEQNLVEQGSA